MGKYTLWTLNRVATWNLDRLAEKLAVRSMFSQRHQVTKGSRSSADVNPAFSKQGVLSHEEHEWDEYFVPIPVKCIGDPDGFLRRLGPRFSNSGAAAAAQLITDFPQYFTTRAAGPWQGYWTLNGTAGMFTAPTGPARADGYKGFYELVVEAADKTGPAVLVGYSQGGLVARFLAYMDELLMPPNKRCVAGVITVQAPNHGSPLANADPANVNSISDGLFSILTGVAGYPISPVDGVMHVQDPATSVMLRAIVRGAPAANGSHADIHIPALLLEAAVSDARTNKKSEDFPATARKWLTGLVPAPSPAPPTAFCDLDPRNLDKPSTILGRLHRFSFGETWHGAVIGSDIRVNDLLAAGRNWLVRLAIRFVPGCLGVANTLAAIEKPWGEICMDEMVSGAGMAPEETRVALAYKDGATVIGTGTKTLKIPPRAHDFVIPSVSQSMHLFDDRQGPRPPKFLGNVLNEKGTHISGGDENDSDSDSGAVRSMLDALGQQLQ
jgi:hypothetical protein